MTAENQKTRLNAIVSEVRRQGYVANEELARQLGVAVQTIRRDVRKLSETGRLIRHHGGAAAPSTVENIDYYERKILDRSAKEAIGACAAAAVPDGASLFVNIGTTTEAFARALAGHARLRVITNNLHVASVLARDPECNVVIAGGAVRVRDGGILGPAAQEVLETYRAEYGVIGISGIDEDGMLLDFDADEVRCAKTIMKNSRFVFLLADHTKFSRRPLVCAGHISEVSAFFTDRLPPQHIRDILTRHDVALHIAQNVRKRT